MNDKICALYNSKEPIDAEGRLYLADRKLSIREAAKAGVCSRDGVVYFLFFHEQKIVRWKARSIRGEKSYFFSKLDSGDQIEFEMPLFGHQTCPLSDYLIITEGEFDCVALRGLNEPNCVSLPNGSSCAKKALKTHYKFLQNFDRIYIAFDNDEAGEKAAAEARSVVGDEKYRRLIFPRKDANDWILHDDPEPEDFKNLMQKSIRIDRESMVRLENLPDDYMNEIWLGQSSGWRSLDKTLGGIRTGELTVISADTGSGKTTFAMNLFTNLANQGMAVWINSYEMTPKIVMRKIASVALKQSLKFEAFSDNLKEKYFQWRKDKKIYVNKNCSEVDIEAFSKELDYGCVCYGFKYVLIDHLDYLCGAKKGYDLLERLDECMKKLHILSMKHDVGIFLVVHPRQLRSGESVTMNDLKGSSAIKQYADNIILMTRLGRTDPNSKSKVRFSVCKNRLVGNESAFCLNYQTDYDGYEEILP